MARFCRNHVPMELASRIQRFVEHAHSQKQKQMAITESWKKRVERDGKSMSDYPLVNIQKAIENGRRHS